MLPSELVILGRIAVAALCGGVVGLHFELRARPAGLRTHALAAMGAALFCAVGLEMSPGSEAVRAVQGVAAGVGFIGAAAVLRRSGHVSGVTNAASIWMSAAIGCAAGNGNWILAIAVSVFVAALSAATLRAERRWLNKPHRQPKDA